MKAMIRVILALCLTTSLVSAQWLRVAPDRRSLETVEGEPFFWMADTAWELFHRLDEEEIDQYLSNRAAKGFNVIQAVLLSECDGLTVPTPQGLLPLDELNPAKPNEAYFDFIDGVVTSAAKKGLYLAILPTWGTHAQDKPHRKFENHSIFTAENARVYGRYLGERYADAWNLVWVIGGDRMPEVTEDIWDSMAQGIEEGDQGKHLITYHPSGERSTSECFADTDWLDFHMLQTGHFARDIPVWEFIERDLKVEPAKPVLNSEPCYDNIPVGFNVLNGFFNDYDCRKAAYRSVFAGAMGHTYGHNSIWQMYDTEREPILEAKVSWREALDFPGAFHMGNLRALVESRSDSPRIPDQSLLVVNRSYQTSFKQSMRDGSMGERDASWIMVYLAQAGGARVDTSVIAGDELNAWWFDPRTGTAYFIEKTANDGIYSPSGKNGLREEMGGPDWVLVIDDASKNFPAPGQVEWRTNQSLRLEDGLPY